jgi:hypothetical protein
MMPIEQIMHGVEPDLRQHHHKAESEIPVLPHNVDSDSPK